jgi:hypothetical protein
MDQSVQQVPPTARPAFQSRPIALRSPQQISITSNANCGSTFQARYFFGGLLFLEPLGTFLNMPDAIETVNLFVKRYSPFPQHFDCLFPFGYT